MATLNCYATRTKLLVRDLLKLSKYRLSALVSFTSAVGYVARADPQQNPDLQQNHVYYRKLLSTTTGTWLAAACANTLNQIYEIRSDALMARTRLRPLPSGRIAVAHAACFAAATGLSGIALLAHETNRTTTALAAANVLLYSAVYTPLKAISTVNTWVGAVVGALPPIHGWAAASDGALLGDRERGAWALGSLLFLWQIPHFHALAVMSRADYAAGGLKMLAVTNPHANAQWAKWTALALLPIGGLFTITGVTSAMYGWESVLLGWWMYRGAVNMLAQPTSSTAARQLFRSSIWYLPMSMSLLMAHQVPYGFTVEQPTKHAANVRELRLQQPWEIMAPFPFLPVPCGVPAVVLETHDQQLS